MNSLFKLTTDDGQVWHIVAESMVKAIQRLRNHHGHPAVKVEQVWPFDEDDDTKGYWDDES